MSAAVGIENYLDPEPGTRPSAVTHSQQLHINRAKAASMLTGVGIALVMIKMIRPSEWTECGGVVANFHTDISYVL
jgi:hypothetical protein